VTPRAWRRPSRFASSHGSTRRFVATLFHRYSGQTSEKEGSMAIERSRRPMAAARIARATQLLLDASTLCAMATVSAGTRAHVNTAYFAWSPRFDLVWLSEPHARHSRNIDTNGTVAIAVYDSRQSWGKPDRGIQLFGSARRSRARPLGTPRCSIEGAFPSMSRAVLPPTASIGSGLAVSSSSTNANSAWAFS
jgi:hypothetical protein